jgi:gluconolactonase
MGSPTPRRERLSASVASLMAALLSAPAAFAGAITGDAPADRPDVTVNLNTAEGLRLVRGEWRYSDARIVEVEHREPGPDLKPSGPPNRTYDIAPHAGVADFDDSSWQVLEAGSLEKRRGHGRLSFNWYRFRFTVPERIGGFDPTGSSVIFEIVVDDYAEVWVDGRLPLVLGQAGGPLVRGYNSPNRVVVARDVRPGRTFTIAVFGMNGPVSNPPGNFIWIRSATLDFFAPGRGGVIRPVAGEVRRLDPALDAVVPKDAKFEKIAEGFLFTEGPVWHPDGYLLFSDPNANAIYRWSPDGQVSVFRTKSGYAGTDIGEYGQPGSNGLTLDAEGRLTINEHGNRRVVRLEKNGVVTILADRYEGKRLNSPNDLVYGSDGALYFTDPPFGLPKAHDDPRRELPFSGVFLLKDGRLTVVSRDLAGPNGLAFSPDEKFLYVGNWDLKKRVVMRYEVRPGGMLGPGQVFVDLTAEGGEDAIDGVKVDAAGNVFVSGPGGLWVVSPEGKRLGTLIPPEHPHNMAFGDKDAKTLYLAARSGLYRIRLDVPGIGPPLRPRQGTSLSSPPTGIAAASSSAPKGGPATPSVAAAPRIERRDPRFDALVPREAVLERVAEGLAWVEGPVWLEDDRSLLFSDIPQNAVYRWREGDGLSLFLKPAGYSGAGPFAGREPGSNGLTLDPEGRLVLCEHGDRRVTRLEADGSRTVLAERYRGRRLNSPNDAVYRRNGDLYFTDPPFGLPQAFADPARELDFAGVFRLSRDGRLSVLTKELSAPNGLALSPDERTLYVSNADPDRPIWMAFPIGEDGEIGEGRLFFDATPWTKVWKGAPDGMKVDRDGNLFAAGPGGVHVFAANGTHLGSLITGVATSNCAWGGDGSVLYITAGTAVHRIRLKTAGAARASGHCPGSPSPRPSDRPASSPDFSP